MGNPTYDQIAVLVHQAFNSAMETGKPFHVVFDREGGSFLLSPFTHDSEQVFATVKPDDLKQLPILVMEVYHKTCVALALHKFTKEEIDSIGASVSSLKFGAQQCDWCDNEDGTLDLEVVDLNSRSKAFHRAVKKELKERFGTWVSIAHKRRNKDDYWWELTLTKIRDLPEELKAALRAENYEQAANLRDIIHQVGPNVPSRRKVKQTKKKETR